MDWQNPFGTDAHTAPPEPAAPATDSAGDPSAPVVIRAELTGDGLRLPCPTPEIVEAIVDGWGRVGPLIDELAELSAAEALAVAPLRPDGWPADTIEPGEPCPRCGSLETWSDLLGGEHCGPCEARKLARGRRLADRADRLRRNRR